MAREDEELRRPIGETGLRGVREGFLYEEYLQALRSIPGAKKFREMVDTDPIIGGISYAFKALLARVKWRIEPADNAGDAQDGAEFMQQVLFEDMAQTWTETLTEILTMLDYGYAPLEIIYKIRQGPQKEERPPLEPLSLIMWLEQRRNKSSPYPPSSKFTDRKIGLHRLSLRAQDSIWKWHFSREGEWLALEQQIPDSTNAIIPNWKIALFRTQSFKNNPEGRSLFRSAHSTYERRQVLEIAEGRVILRLAGVAHLQIPGQIMKGESDEDIAAYADWKTVGANLAKDAQGALITPSDRDENGNLLYDFSFKTTQSSRGADISAAITRHATMIAATVLADFMMLGQNAGNRALSEDKTEMFEASLNYFNTTIAEVINRQVIARLWEVNGFNPATMPKAVPSPVDKRDVAKLATFLKDLTTAGAQVFPNRKLLDGLFDEAMLPEIPDEMHDAIEEATLAGIEADIAGAEARTVTAQVTADQGGIPPQAPNNKAPAKS